MKHKESTGAAAASVATGLAAVRADHALPAAADGDSSDEDGDGDGDDAALGSAEAKGRRPPSASKASGSGKQKRSKAAAAGALTADLEYAAQGAYALTTPLLTMLQSQRVADTRSLVAESLRLPRDFTLDQLTDHFLATVKPQLAQLVASVPSSDPYAMPTTVALGQLGAVICRRYALAAARAPRKKANKHRKKVRQAELFWSMDMSVQLLLRLVYLAASGKLQRREAAAAFAAAGAKDGVGGSGVGGTGKQKQKAGGGAGGGSTAARLQKEVVDVSSSDSEGCNEDNKEKEGIKKPRPSAAAVDKSDKAPRAAADGRQPADDQQGQPSDASAGVADGGGGGDAASVAALARRARRAVGKIASSIQSLQDGLAAAKPPETGWKPAVLKEIRDGVQAALNYRPGKLQSLAVFVEFILKGTVSATPTGAAAAADGSAAAGDKSAAAAPAPLPQLHVSLQQLVEAAAELSQGCSVGGLASLELQLAARFGATAFSQLGLGPSLLQAMERSAVVAAAVSGGGLDGGCLAPLDEVLDVAAQALAATSDTSGAPSTSSAATAPAPTAAAAAVASGSFPDTPAGLSAAATGAAVAAVLCSHFGVERVEQLGHGPTRRLVKLCASGQRRPNACVLSIHALAAPPSAADGQLPLQSGPASSLGEQQSAGSFAFPASAPGVGALGEVDYATALACLQAAPVLCDLEHWTQWRPVFQPSLGPLDAFLRAHGLRADVLALAVPPRGGGAAAELPALQLPAQGRLIKVAGGLTVEDFVECASRMDGRGAASALLSLVMQSGSARRAPLALLALHAEGCMQAVAAEASAAARGDADGAASTVAAMTASSSSSNSGRARAAHFVLSCLSHIPLALLPTVGDTVLLEPFIRAVGNPSLAHACLLDAAVASGSAALRSLLHHCGFLLGVTRWVDEWKKSCAAVANKAPAALAAPRPAAAAAAAATGLPLSAGQLAAGGEDVEMAEAMPGTEAGALALPPALQQLLRGAELPQATAHAAVAAQHASVADYSIARAAQMITPEAPAANGAGAAAATSTTATAPTTSTAIAAPSPSSSAAVARAVVESIRREEFGLGLSLDAQAAALRERQNQRMGRALQRLSAELYSKDSHFVLELVQNADDK